MSCTSYSESTGARCSCAAYDRRDSMSKSKKCVCGHKRSSHSGPPPGQTYGDILQKFSGRITEIRRKGTSDDATARKETSSGFRPSDPGPATRKSSDGRFKSKKSKPSMTKLQHKEPARQPTLTRVGSVTFLPNGIGTVDLPTAIKVPSVELREEYRRYGLVVTDLNNKPLEYSDEWSQDEVNTWLKKVFPLPMEWLDRRYGLEPEQGIHWRPAKTSYNKIIVLTHPSCGGRVLHEMRGKNKKWQDCNFYIVSRKRIPLTVFRDFGAALENASTWMRFSEDVDRECTDDDDDNASASAKNSNSSSSDSEDEAEYEDRSSDANADDNRTPPRRIPTTRSGNTNTEVLELEDSDDSRQLKQRHNKGKGRAKKSPTPPALDVNDSDHGLMSLAGEEDGGGISDPLSCVLGARKRAGSDGLEVQEGRVAGVKQGRYFLSQYRWPTPQTESAPSSSPQKELVDEPPVPSASSSADQQIASTSRDELIASSSSSTGQDTRSALRPLPARSRPQAIQTKGVRITNNFWDN